MPEPTTTATTEPTCPVCADELEQVTDELAVCRCCDVRVWL
jgi:hypothetical protein